MKNSAWTILAESTSFPISLIITKKRGKKKKPEVGVFLKEMLYGCFREIKNSLKLRSVASNQNVAKVSQNYFWAEILQWLKKEIITI